MQNFEEDISLALHVLQSGGLILYPTDTIWGIGCDATNSAAVQKIFRLKNRDEQKAMIVLVAGERDVLKYTAAPDLAIFDYLQKAQKPTTVIYPGAIGLAENLVATDGSIAIRICKDPFCKQLIKRFRKPLVSTSANISGKPAPRSFAEIDEEIKKQVDYIVRYRQDDPVTQTASTVVKWDKGRIEVIRG
jgi:L-threonylcarbamoyladenylate synthase